MPDFTIYVYFYNMKSEWLGHKLPAEGEKKLI